MTAIEARKLGKWYRRVGMGPPTLLGTLAFGLRKKRIERFWAVRDLDFALEAGRSLGIIGANGSGKSSVLGLIAGTIAPSQGEVRVNGRIASLLELGAGFHPDLSGRENIFLNAALLGISRDVVLRQFDRIVDFSGLAQFIDMPVKHYSSGMYVRLGFAVAVQLDPDILLIDEVLAVGDIAFQLKCMAHIRELQRRGKTLVLVSHALQTIEEFCDEVFVLHDGRLVERGAPRDAILKYMRAYMGEGGGLYTQEYGSRDVEFVAVRLLDGSDRETGVFDSGGTLVAEILYRACRRIERPVFGFSLKTGNGLYIHGSNTQIAGYGIDQVEGEGTIRLVLEPLTLIEGNFVLSVSVHSEDHREQYHRREDWYPFAVRRTGGALGLFELPSRWERDSGHQGGECAAGG